MPRKPRKPPSALRIGLIDAGKHLSEAEQILRAVQVSPEIKGRRIEDEHGFTETLSAFLELSIPRLEFIRRQLGKVKD